MGRKAAMFARAERHTHREAQPVRPEVLDDLDEDETIIQPTGDATPETGVDVDTEETVEVDASITDNVGEQSIEINVESLIAEVEAESKRGAPDIHQCARRKLEDYLERKRIAHELEDFEDFVV